MAVRSLKALDRQGRVTAYPLQKPGVAVSSGLTREQCEQAAWAITPDRRHYRGAAAVHVAFSWAVGQPRLLALYGLPAVRQFEDIAYAMIARYRSRLPGVTPHCQQFPDDCSA